MNPKKDSVEITQEQARKLVLRAQGLSGVQESSLDAIKRLSYVQIDTISVAERAHHHVFFSRNADYQKEDLDRMVSDRSVFEYWSHAAAFLPIEDFRFSLYHKAEVQKADKFWFEKDKKVMRKVLKRIKEEGPLGSKDFEKASKVVQGWSDWKPAKVALQLLFMEGKLMISERQSFQKVYDLTERVYPDSVGLKKPSQKEYCDYLIDRAISAQGIVTETEMGYLRKGLKKPIQLALAKRIGKKDIIRIKVDGRPELYYSSHKKINDLDGPIKQNLHLLSPFDNLVIQRNRVKQLFDFDYLIECYVPEKKRKFGYYTLPILHGDRFVGRLDPKADRKTGTFHIKKLWFEDGFIPDEHFCDQFAAKIKAFARFCGCNKLVLSSVSPTTYKTQLKKHLRDA
ncbi:winged helix-turn-helix domain-containing protein [Roseivirga sp. E12]|uniref:winged helix-turn-helix domain-containing protein n=1 Tax=Roseivirga sp. E12 TaxID=2819237 RepID=UPI001ABC2453|nr:crosslink repair DNA glycosylase YcaQ family protein [Roseivirga sp. E12]MBO3696982.1 YcaQ family DNA glycosylase [Roseivirga sp. E12]